MSSFHVPANQTVSWSVFFRSVMTQMDREGYALPHAFFTANQKHIERAFDYGEPIWCIVAELKMRRDTTPMRRTKTPLSMAVRVVRP